MTPTIPWVCQTCGNKVHERIYTCPNCGEY